MEPSPPPTSSEHPNPLDHWRHRRRLAYASFLMLVLITLGVFLDRIPATLQPVMEALIWVYAFLIIGYYGNNALDAWAKRGR